MLLPYNVDRVTRRVPWITYGLMATNTIIFLLTVLAANMALPTDREEGQMVIAALVKDAPPINIFDDEESEPQGSGQPVQNRFGLSPTFKSQNSDPLPSSDPSDSDSGMQMPARYQQLQALIIASQKLETPEDTKRLYVIQHAYDTFVDEPHYSILNSFAYRPNNPSALEKLLTMFTAMFLHGSLDHLLGNMLFLWIFGRAIEEFLGEKFFISTYLIAGVAATLLQHLVTQFFQPQAMGVPNLGASGAIAGILGLFAVRFYRTKVRIFYLFGWGLWAFFICFGIVTAIIDAIIHQPLVSVIVGLGTAAGALFVLGRDNSWGAFRVPSIWVIGVWIVLLNIVPALWQMTHPSGGEGVAYWAHVGGLLCGALYALAIGGADDGKTEYALEDAHTALQNAGNEEAIKRAGAILQKDGNNPAAHEVVAHGYDRSQARELAARHYNLAIEGYWKAGERNAAVRLYGMALENHPHLNLRPALLLSLSNHFAQSNLWDQSASVLTRLVEEYPESPEAEIALLRAAQLWMKQYSDPAESLRMMQMFHATYPQSQWQTQAQSVEKAARDMLSRGG